jgi:hypothetical protein
MSVAQLKERLLQNREKHQTKKCSTYSLFWLKLFLVLQTPKAFSVGTTAHPTVFCGRRAAMPHIQKQYRLPSEAMKWLHLTITLLSHHADLVVHLQLSAVALLSCRANVATQTKGKKKIEPRTNLQGLSRFSYSPLSVFSISPHISVTLMRPF